MHEITRILNKPETAGNSAELLPLVYEELRNLARGRMSQEPPGQTLQATALVHEAFLRLTNGEKPTWANRAHFFAAAAEAMRRILIDRARRRCAMRRGGGQENLPLEDLQIAAPGPDEEILALHDVLDAFSKVHPGKAELVKLKYFAGLSTEEAADVLGISSATAKRQWAFARAWLFREINR